MSQTDSFHIPNLAGGPFRALLNQILAALSEQNSGSSEPQSPFSGMVWLDTSSNPPEFKLRNAANNGWVRIFTAETAPTKSQVGLGNVPNYSATSSLSDGSANKVLLAAAGKVLQDNKLDKTAQAYDSARLGNKLANQYVLITGTYSGLRAQATTKSDVGLGNVQNYGITSSLTTNNASLHASAKAVYDLNQNKVDKSVTVNGKPLTGSINLTAVNIGAATPKAVQEAVENALPAGSIILWAGTVAQIPAGYQLCNGSGKTTGGIQIPDLRDRFIVGAGDTYNPADMGGSTNKTTSTGGAHSHSVSVGNTTLSISQIPSHRHAATGNKVGGSLAGGWRYTSLIAGGDARTSSGALYTGYTGSSSSHNHSASSNSTGSHNHTVDVRPPYYALCYIIKL
ncbi:phage tail protein [Endozoicomonas numazuensis]|uniref:Phage tail collar domain-containing protein n=1 Tax=Endozoicomonas numazuensis TaxID=1137799 RepID=A0A081NL41_9GAMM|nr:phage tail protein [Endozoicomonas numazuensis]KEQ19164.1 hypothetical protein GZ78_03975 [Endozoicomonas numazuensis]